ncbi:MAG: hypothetical protein RLZ12_281, partial [Bacillota bacterium]
MASYDSMSEMLEAYIVYDGHRLASTIELGVDNYRSLLFNKPSSLALLAEVGTRNNLLRLHGLQVANEEEHISTEYIVCVFQTDVVLLYKLRKANVWLRNSSKPVYTVVKNSVNNRKIRKVRQVAIRAIYALGLDYGVVKCGVKRGRDVVILNLFVDIVLNKRMLHAFKQALYKQVQSFYLAEQKPRNLLLGCDLEFILKKPEGELALASNYFPIYGHVGCDNVGLGQRRDQKPIGELRPKPARTTSLLVLEIYNCLSEAMHRTRNTAVNFLAGAMPLPGFPLGGHIHFSGLELDFHLLRALDNYLALPCILLEDEASIARRPKYGFLGDFRHQRHGGFEYRVLSSWLHTPEL